MSAYSQSRSYLTPSLRFISMETFSYWILQSRKSLFDVNAKSHLNGKCVGTFVLHCKVVISSDALKLVDNQPQNLTPSPPTRMQSFLSNNGTVTFIQPSSTQDLPKNFTSLAYRLAHDLHVYHRLDSQVVEMTDETELTWPHGNVVLIGTLNDRLIRYVLSQGKTPLAIQGDHLTLNGHNLNTNIHTGTLQLLSEPPI